MQYRRITKLRLHWIRRGTLSFHWVWPILLDSPKRSVKLCSFGGVRGLRRGGGGVVASQRTEVKFWIANLFPPRTLLLRNAGAIKRFIWRGMRESGYATAVVELRNQRIWISLVSPNLYQGWGSNGSDTCTRWPLNKCAKVQTVGL